MLVVSDCVVDHLVVVVVLVGVYRRDGRVADRAMVCGRNGRAQNVRYTALLCVYGWLARYVYSGLRRLLLK